MRLYHARPGTANARHVACASSHDHIQLIHQQYHKMVAHSLRSEVMLLALAYSNAFGLGSTVILFRLVVLSEYVCEVSS